MFSWKEFEKTKTILSQESSYQDLGGQHHVTIRPVNLLKWIEVASVDLGFFTLVEIAAVDLKDSSKNGYRYEMTYHLLNMGTHQRMNIHVRFNDEELLPSVVSYFSHADWMEREQQETLGINFNRKMDPLLFPKDKVDAPLEIPALRSNPNKSEAPYPEESYVWKNYDLFSPYAMGNFEWLVCYDPRKIVDVKTNIGFHHQGLENLFAAKDWQQAMQLVDKINLGAAPTYGIAWAKTLEDLLRVKLTERAQAIRIVALELGRIAEHLTVMHEMTFALQMDEHRLFINAREKIYELMEKYCGRRLGLNVARIGGIREDLPHGWIVEYQAVWKIFAKTLRTIHRSLLGQHKFRDSLSAGVVSAQTALEWGVSGPAMRACGINFDLRKSQPFYFYQDIDFDIPVGINGTGYERYLIRYEEIFQSFRIITQVIDNLPLGEIMNPDYDKDYMKLSDYLSGMELSKAWQYTGIESPNGEAGFLVMFNEHVSPFRVKIKTPSFPLVQGLSHFLQGIGEEQLKACFASLGIRRTELDR